MKKCLAFVLTVVSLWAADFRPPVPDVGVAVAKQKVLQECKVPAQVVVLPPLVEPDYKACANAYYKPDAREAAYHLSVMFDQEVKVEKISEAEDFVRAYEIVVNIAGAQASLICNEIVSRCYPIGAAQTEKKDKK